MALKELKQKGEILMVRLKCTQDSERCFMFTVVNIIVVKYSIVLCSEIMNE